MSNLAEQQETVLNTCLAALECAPLSVYTPILPDPERCLESLQVEGAQYVGKVASQHNLAASGDLARCILVKAVPAALARLEQQRVSESVKRLLLQDFLGYAYPPARWARMFDPGSVRFHEMVKLATFQRFPAGQQHWETVKWFPRRWLLKVRPKDALRLYVCLLKLGGRGPLWELHVNDRRPNPGLLAAKGAHQSYYRIAESLRMQPEVKAVLAAGWMHSTEVARVSPHLSWLRDTFQENGGTIAELGFASPDSGFLVGDLKRKELYQRGEFRPRSTIAIWPRRAMLRWSEQHPEFDRS